MGTTSTVCPCGCTVDTNSIACHVDLQWVRHLQCVYDAAVGTVSTAWTVVTGCFNGVCGNILSQRFISIFLIMN